MILREKKYLEGYNGLLRPIASGKIVEAEVVGKTKEGVVVALENFGLGIIWRGEIMHSGKSLNSFKKGDKVPVKVHSKENDEGFMEVSFIDAQQDIKWQDIENIVQNDQTITIKVANFNKGGVSSSYNDIEVFLPISKISKRHFAKDTLSAPPSAEELKKLIGTDLTVKIISLDKRDNQIVVSEIDTAAGAAPAETSDLK